MEALELWVASLSRQKVSYSSILTRLSAVRHKWKKLKGDRKLSSQRLTLMLKGLKRKSSKRPEKNPVTMSHLKRLHNAANRLGKDRACLFKAMSTLAFFGFLRPSEFCISRSKHHLHRKDVRLGKSGKSCRINFRSFKHSDGTRVVKIEEQAQSPISIMKILRSYLDRTPIAQPHQPLFDMTLKEFRSLLQELCEEAAIKSKITPHCFRVGGATWANQQGWSDARIQHHGRWKSTAYKSYIKS